MIDRADPLENASVEFERPGLSYDQGRYSGFEPFPAGNKEGTLKAADWNWLSLHFSPMQSSIQAGGAINAAGQSFQNIRVFGLALPDIPQGQVLFSGANNQVSGSNSLFWDNTNLILKLNTEGSSMRWGSVSGSQPYNIITGHYVNNATNDPTIAIGYNIAGPIAAASNPITAGIQQHQIGLEGAWNPTGAYTQVEFNHDYYSPDGLTHRRGFLMTVRNDTFAINWNWYADTFVWDNSANTSALMQLVAGTLTVFGTAAGFVIGNPAVTFQTDGSSNVVISSATANAITQVIEPTPIATNSQFQVLSDATLAADEGGGIGLGARYTGTTKTVLAYVKGGKENATDGNFAGYLAFFTRPNGGSYTEALRISSAQLVGVHTTTPRRFLDVLDAANPQARFTFTDNSVYTDFKTDSAGSLNILPTSGKVYVGTFQSGVVAPTSIGTYVAGSNWFIVRDTTDSVEAIVGAFSGGVLLGATTNHSVFFRTGNTNAFLLDGSQILSPQIALATNMTKGFVNIPGAAGQASGAPATTTGFPLYYDSTNDQLGIYNAAWKWIAAGKVTLGVEKTADQTITNSIVLTDDTALTVNVLAGKTYRFRFVIFQTSASVTAGISLSVNGTCTANSIKFQGFDIAGTPLFGRGTALGGSVGFGLGTGDNFLEIEGTIEVNAAGTLKLQWAQKVADAVNGTTVQRNSYMECIQLA